MRVDAKIQARQWILNAIQHHSCIPNKETEHEIRKLVTRFQRDIKQLARARDLFLAVNSDNPEIKARAIRELTNWKQPKARKRHRKTRKDNAEVIRLVREQRADVNDRRIRFEHASSGDQ